MRRLADYRRDEFEWRRQEAKLNEFEHRKVHLDDIELHFIHQPGVGSDPTRRTRPHRSIGAASMRPDL